MHYQRHPHHPPTRKPNAPPDLTLSLVSEPSIQLKHSRVNQVDSDDDRLDGSQAPSMTTGSSRTSSVCSHSEQAPALRSVARGISDSDSVYVPDEDGIVSQRHRTESPSPSCHAAVSRVPRYPSPLSFSVRGHDDVQSCGLDPATTTGQSSMRTIGNASKPSMKVPIRTTLAQSTTAAPDSAEDVKMQSRTSSFDTESTDSNSESEEESDDDDEEDDDDWSGVNDHFEAAILHAVFPDLELAAHLITRLCGMSYPYSSEGISKKVSSWQERITVCPNGSGTANTETPSSNATSSTPRQSNSKRERPYGSTCNNIGGEEDEDEDDDTDENRPQRPAPHDKSDNGDGIPTMRMACPFFKMNPIKYSVQQDGHVNDKQYRTCAGPGFRSIQTLKEHLKRKHYPVQCDRCYVIIKVKGKDRASAVSELERHRQQDDRCPRNPGTMKEGISDAQWASLDDKKQGRKGKGPAEKPGYFEKWKEIWAVLFPSIPPPSTPWYDVFSVAAPVSHHSQGLQQFLEVQVQTMEYKLPAIKAARSDDELKSLLLDLAQKVFQVWSNVSWNEASTSSLSNPEGSSGSWDRISSNTVSGQRGLPKLPAPSMFPNMESDKPRKLSGMASSIVAGCNSAVGDQRATTQSPYLVNTIVSTPQNTPQNTAYSANEISSNTQPGLDISEDFHMVEALSNPLDTFPQAVYPSNISSMEERAWLDNMQLQYHNSPANFDDINMGRGIHANDFDLVGASPHSMPNMQIARWGDEYPHPNFGRYHGGS